MTINEFAATVRGALPYTPNDQQRQLIDALARFCSSATPTGSVFILNGYAEIGRAHV